MDIGQITRPSISPVQPVARPDAPGVGRPVKTDLPQAKAVAAAVESAPASAGKPLPVQSANQALAGFISRNTDIDRDSRTIITQTLDTRSGEVVHQYPDINAIRLRAYLTSIRERNLAERATEHETELHVERIA